MPAVGNAQNFRSLPPAPAPKPAPANLATGNNPRGTAIVQPKVVTPPRMLMTGANPRGTAIVQAQHPPTPGDIAATHPDPAATVKVFRAQPIAQQKAIVAGALKTPTPAGQIVLNYLKTTGNYANLVTPPHGQSVLAPLGNLGHLGLSSVYGGSPDAKGPGAQYGAVMFGGPKGAKQILAHTAKDTVNLPAEAFSSIATPVGDLASGKVGKAIGDVINPFVSLVEHPAQSFYAHPLDSYLMATGAVHGLSRLAAAPVRAFAPDSALGRAVSTEREGVALTGKLTAERAPYSKSPTVKAGQVALEKTRYERAPTGELVPKSEGVRAKLVKKGVGELVGVQERIRRANRSLVQAAREQQITPGLAARVGKAAKRTLAYGSQKAVIPGADVLARIADGTIRRPDTIGQDIATHLQQVSANRADLLGEPKALKAHDAYVKTLAAAAKNKSFLSAPAAAFKAAEAYAKDYGPVQSQAANLGHFGEMDPQALQRRALMHYAVTHMDARMDPNLGLVTDRVKAGYKPVGPVPATPPTEPVPLSNAEILQHLKGPNGTAGRIPAYTPDRPRFDAEKQARQANYVSSARRPLPATQKNTLYSYTHGLTEPGHSALTEQHTLMQGVVDSHRAQNAYLDTLATQKQGGGYWSKYADAQKDAPKGYSPINVSQPFHPQGSLDQALQTAAPASIEEEAVRRSLDLNARMQPGTTGRWAIIDDRAAKALNDHQNQISPNTALRTIRSLNNQFRTVALSTSPKHVPGVAQENLLRDIAQGVGVRSWITGRRILSRAEQMRPVEGANIRTALTGGQLAGMTEAGKTYAVSDHWVGTSIHPVLRAMEATFKMPGPRQLRTAWRAWTHFAIGTTKRLLEQQHQIAGVGKAALREHGYAEAAKTDGFMGLAQRAFGLQGQMLNDAANGLFDPAKARQMRAVVNQLYGKWTDFGPSAQTALMFSPFGLWWINSAKFLARAPVDMPVKTALLASTTVGTEKERQAKGLDMFSPGHLPLYEQGGIPVGNKILAQNYYSPMGIANNPAETATSLLEPWALTPANTLAFGINWLGKPLTAVNQNTNRYTNEKNPSITQDIQYVLDSAAASFIPLYTKAEQLAEGGSSPYDVSKGGIIPPIFRGRAPDTKTPSKGLAAGAKKALFPVREYGVQAPTSGGSWGGGTSSSGSSSSGWGGGTTTTGGWGG